MGFQYVFLLVCLYILWRSVEKYNTFAPKGMKEIGRKVVRVLAMISIFVALWCMVNVFVFNKPAYKFVEPWTPKAPVFQPAKGVK